MKAFFFPWSWTSLLAQTAADAFGPLSTDEWRVTSRHHVDQPGPATAVLAGTIIVQQSAVAGQLNIVLQPVSSPSFLPRPVRYIIYRGIRQSSLVAADGETLQNDPAIPFLARIWDDQELATPSGTVAPPPTTALLGLDLTASPQSDLREILSAPADALSLPIVKAGEPLGEWVVGAVGLEIVLAERGAQTTLADCRLTEKHLSVTPPAGSAAAQDLAASLLREQLLAYLDPCSFFCTLFAANALHFTDPAPPDLDQFKGLFANRDLLTIDIRNEHGHALNFYRNYGPSLADPPPIKGGFGADPMLPLHYETDSWPLLRVDMSGQAASFLRLQLPRADNPDGALALARGRFAHFSYRQIPSLPADSSDPDFTAPFALHVPRQGDVYVPGRLELCYLRPLPAAATPAGAPYRPVHNTVNDAHFDLTGLVDGQGLRLPLPAGSNLSTVHLNLAPVTLAADGVVVRGDLGIAVDQIGVYLFVLPASRRLSEPAPAGFLSAAANLWDDPRFGRLFNIENISWENVGSDTAVLRLPHLQQVPGLQPRHLLALSLDEWHTLRQGSPLWADPLALKWLHLEPDTPPSGSPAVTVMKLTQSLCGLDSAAGQLALVDHAEPVSPIRFYAGSTATTCWFSNAYLAAAFPQQAATPLQNRTDFGGSYCIADARVTLRSSPEARQISKSAWQAAAGDETALTNSTNALGQVPGYRPAPINIIGKRQVNGQDWFFVELREETELIKPTRITSNYQFIVEDVAEEDKFLPAMAGAPFPACGNLFSLPAGSTGWIAGFDLPKEGVYKVATFSRFMKDLAVQLDGLTANNPNDEWRDVITRLRRLTKERHPNTGLPSFDIEEKEGVLGRMFDLVIGTVEPDSSADYDFTPTAMPADGLESIAYAPGPQATYANQQVDTGIQMFRDYMGVQFTADIVLDLHHLFVGLDVHNHRHQNWTITRDMLLFAFGMEFDYGMLPDTYSYTLPDNAHAALWAGDLGAIFTTRTHHLHNDYEKDWQLDNPPPAGAPFAWEEQRLAQFRDHYFRGLAGSPDLFADLLSYRLSADIERRVRNEETISTALLQTLGQLHQELNLKGTAAAMNYFVQDLQNHPGGDPVRWVEDLIINFSQIFEVRQRVQDAIKESVTLALIGDPTQLTPLVLEQIEDEIRTQKNNNPNPASVASRFLRWIADHGGPDLLQAS